MSLGALVSRSTRIAVAIGLLLSAAPPWAHAKIYECRGPDGAKVFTDSPAQLEKCTVLNASPPPPPTHNPFGMPLPAVPADPTVPLMQVPGVPGAPAEYVPAPAQASPFADSPVVPPPPPTQPPPPGLPAMPTQGPVPSDGASAPPAPAPAPMNPFNPLFPTFPQAAPGGAGTSQQPSQ
ncbi:hypothetical protein [Nitrospira sp. Kam-Ns4a]